LVIQKLPLQGLLSVYLYFSRQFKFIWNIFEINVTLPAVRFLAEFALFQSSLQGLQKNNQPNKKTPQIKIKKKD